MADTVALMRKRVLDMAIRGELVDQRKEDGTADQLYNSIQIEKGRLIESGKFKKNKALSEIEEAEMPFDIPDNWKWVKLNDLSSLITDGAHKTPTYVDEGVPFLSIKNISQGYLNISDIKYISQEEHEELIKRCHPEKGDILFCRIGTLGRAHLIENDFDFSIFVSVGLVKIINKKMGKYLKYMMDSPEFYRQLNEVKVVGSHASKLNLRDVRNMLIPLPPISEQERIVAKIEEIFAVIDQIGKRKVEALRIIQNMRQTALQDAIRGVLVEQDETDEPAFELLKKIKKNKERLIDIGERKKATNVEKISKEDLPFEIPEDWEWARVNELVEINLGFTYRPQYQETGKLFLSVKDLADSGINLNNAKYISNDEFEEASYGSKPKRGDLLFGRVGTLGKPRIVDFDEEFCIFVSLGFFRTYDVDNIKMEYLSYWMESNLFWMQVSENVKGSAQQNLNTGWLKNFIIPFPPLFEQERIVAKLDKIMAICDQMEVILDGTSEANEPLKVAE